MSIIKVDYGEVSGGIAELVIPVKALGAYPATAISIDLFKSFKYIRAMSLDEMNNYFGVNPSITLTLNTFNVRKINSSGTSTQIATPTTTDTDISTLDLSDAVCINIGIDGSGNTNNGFCIYLHN